MSKTLKNKNSKKMQLHELSTQQILDILDGTLVIEHDFTVAELAEELKNERTIPENYEVVELRGGIRPTRPSL